MEKKQFNTMALIGFLLAMSDIIIFIICLSLKTLSGIGIFFSFLVGITAVAGLVLSIIGSATKHNFVKSLGGLAVTGIVISSIHLLFFLFMLPTTIDEINVMNKYSVKSINTDLDYSTSKPSTDSKELKDVTITDFSALSKYDSRNWCTSNNIKCTFNDEYNDNIESGKLISQSVASGEVIKENDSITLVFSLGHKETLGESNAVRSAKEYLNVLAFSRSGLIHQLEYEGYSTAEATYAVDHIVVDWNEQAAKSAKQYLNAMSFSRSGLIQQLEYEGFTHDQAVYGVTQNGY